MPNELETSNGIQRSGRRRENGDNKVQVEELFIHETGDSHSHLCHGNKEGREEPVLIDQD